VLSSGAAGRTCLGGVATGDEDREDEDDYEAVPFPSEGRVTGVVSRSYPHACAPSTRTRAPEEWRLAAAATALTASQHTAPVLDVIKSTTTRAQAQSVGSIARALSAADSMAWVAADAGEGSGRWTSATTGGGAPASPQ